MNINNRLAKNDVKNTYDYSPRSIMKHQLREDPRRKKKRRGEENKNKQREKPDALIENSRRRPFIDDRADREIADFPPLQRNESHPSTMVRPVERQRETERERERRGRERCGQRGFDRHYEVQRARFPAKVHRPRGRFYSRHDDGVLTTETANRNW